MIFPIGDKPNPVGFTPFVNYALIAANVLVYGLITLPLSNQSPVLDDPLVVEYLNYLKQLKPSFFEDIRQSISAYDVVTFHYGFKPGAFEVSDLFSSMFLHGGFLHLAGNMLFLWIYGDNVEYRFGRVGYLVLYLSTGVIATAVFALIAGDSMTPMIGASGAISGILGLYFVLFPQNVVKLLLAFWPIFYHTFYVKARIVLGFYLVIDNILPMILGTQSGVAYGAHLGGFAGGYLLARVGAKFFRSPAQLPDAEETILRQSGSPSSQSGSEIEPRQALVNSLLSAIRTADSQSVSRIYRQHPDVSQLLPIDFLLNIAFHLNESGHDDEAIHLLKQCLGAKGTRQEKARVYLALGVHRMIEGKSQAAFDHIQSALDLDPDEETHQAALAALKKITH